MASQNADIEAFFAETNKLKPRLAEIQKQLHVFAQHARGASFEEDLIDHARKVVLITSGGTTVPLESNTIRFMDNFSSGTRGALCAEEFLEAGYSVVFLYREGSKFPFLADLDTSIKKQPLDLLLHSSPDANGASSLQITWKKVPPRGDLRERLLPIPFTTVFDYLFILREACKNLAECGSGLLVFLAAAVADFYIPEKELSAEKIQSRSNDGLTVKLKNTPKLIGCIKDWAPEATVVSFKLETNENILAAKAAGSIQAYGVDAVCANTLQTHRQVVTVIRKDESASKIAIAKDNIEGEEASPVAVEGISSQRIEKASDSVIEKPLVKAVVKIHESCEAERPSKRAKVES